MCEKNPILVFNTSSSCCGIFLLCQTPLFFEETMSIILRHCAVLFLPIRGYWTGLIFVFKFHCRNLWFGDTSCKMYITCNYICTWPFLPILYVGDFWVIMRMSEMQKHLELSRAHILIGRATVLCKIYLYRKERVVNFMLK